MKILVTMESEDMPDTQPVEDSGNETSFFTQNSEPVKYWGRLYPLVNGFRPLDLIENDLTFGTGGIGLFCNAAQCSRSEDICFKIKRKTVRKRGRLTAESIISDESPKGILVNCKKVQGRIGNVVLQTNDIISFPDISGGHKKAYVFIDSCNPVCDINVPAKISRNYQISCRLGAGAFGEVFLAFDKTSCHPLAMKTILEKGFPNNDDSKRHSKLLNELNVLKSVNHTHVIQLVDAIEYKQRNYIFLEYMEGNDLSEKIREKTVLTEDIAKLYFYQICKGVQYLHNKGIIHRDIKPANVLLKSAKTHTLIKLTDFGLSKILTPSTVMKTICGTKMYAAPELLSGDAPYTSQVDVWALGVLLFTCLSGSEPFSVASHLIEKHIKWGLYVMPSESWSDISIFAKNVIDVMLLTDPEKRIEMNEILNDVWLQDPSMLGRLKRIYLEFGIVMDS